MNEKMAQKDEKDRQLKEIEKRKPKPLNSRIINALV